MTISNDKEFKAALAKLDDGDRRRIATLLVQHRHTGWVMLPGRGERMHRQALHTPRRILSCY